MTSDGQCLMTGYATPGWTRNPSQFINRKLGIDAGEMEGGLQEFFNDASETLGGSPESEEKGLRMAAQESGGICKSYITDGPDSESWFYFIRTKGRQSIGEHEARAGFDQLDANMDGFITKAEMA